MKDRVPRYPGRVQLTPVAGQANVFDLVRADEPIEAGTALCKGNLLSDATAALLGLSENAVPDEAFAASYLKAIGKTQVYIEAYLPNGNPAAFADITGLTGATETRTDANGKLLTFVTSSSVTLSFTNYMDAVCTPVTVQTPIGQRVSAKITSTRRGSPNFKILTSTTNLRFSSDVDNFDVFAVGGGGGAGKAPGSGGGGGKTKTALSIKNTNNAMDAVIGDGGGWGLAGGKTSFATVSAEGGKGGNASSSTAGGSGGSGGGGQGYAGSSGNKAGGAGGTNGGNGSPGAGPGGSGQGLTTRAFGEAGGELFSGGGGGSGTSPGVGGAGGGGRAGTTNGSQGSCEGYPGSPNSGGGGGGGGTNTQGYIEYGGFGGSGIILVRWRYKTA